MRFPNFDVITVFIFHACRETFWRGLMFTKGQLKVYAGQETDLTSIR
jgi:hypothetical protein